MWCCSKDAFKGDWRRERGRKQTAILRSRPVPLPGVLGQAHPAAGGTPKSPHCQRGINLTAGGDEASPPLDSSSRSAGSGRREEAATR